MSKKFDLDQGTAFGTWDDRVSKLMYQDSTKLFNTDIKDKKVADFGGANGLLGKALNIKNYIVVDIDNEKQNTEQFINDSILTHQGEYDTIVIRYVLHYLSDNEVKELVNNIKSFHKGELIILQFTNEGNNLKEKLRVSKTFEQPTDGKKFFRTRNELFDLLNELGFPEEIKEVRFSINEEFYNNRFGLDIDSTCHTEELQYIKYILKD